jgi:hypothetical protein
MRLAAAAQPGVWWGPDGRGTVVVRERRYMVYLNASLPPYVYDDAETAATTLAAVWKYQEPKQE